MLYHCSTGKDRAGFATFLVLSTLDLIQTRFWPTIWSRTLLTGF
nr:tyrosine-protein phosphatase [Paraburkholderia sp. LEh10]